jgi:hypothetical protein
MYPHQFEQDADLKLAFHHGLEGFKSDSLDFVMEHAAHFPLTLVLFYDSQIYLTKIMESLATKILDIFLFKYEDQFTNDVYKDFTPTNPNSYQIYVEDKYQKFDFSENPGTTFESALPLIFEDSLNEYIKELYISLSATNL